jgi:hypothetical protein
MAVTDKIGKIFAVLFLLNLKKILFRINTKKISKIFADFEGRRYTTDVFMIFLSKFIGLYKLAKLLPIFIVADLEGLKNNYFIKSMLKKYLI